MGKSKQTEYYSFEGLQNTDLSKFWNGLIRSDKLNAAELRLYFAISTLRKYETVFVSRETLAERIGGRSVDKISNYISKLCELGLLETTERRTKKGRFSTNIYKLTDIRAWLKSNDLDTSWCGVMSDMVTSPFLSDSELRLYLVLRSWSGRDHIELAIKELIKYTNISENTLLKTRKDLIEKKLITYERKSSTLNGADQRNEYYINDEAQWLADQILNN